MQNNALRSRPNRPSRRWRDEEGRKQALWGVGTGLRFVLDERKNHWRTASRGPPGRRIGFRGARVAAGKTGNEYGVQRRSGGCGGGGESEWMV